MPQIKFIHLPHPSIMLYNYQKGVFMESNQVCDLIFKCIVGGLLGYLLSMVRTNQKKITEIQNSDKWMTKDSHERNNTWNESKYIGVQRQMHRQEMFLQSKYPEFKDIPR
jgi:hypothetical protein